MNLFKIVDMNEIIAQIPMPSLHVNITKADHCWVIWYMGDYGLLFSMLRSISSKKMIEKNFKKYNSLFWWEARGKDKYRQTDDNMLIFENFEDAEKCLNDYIMPLYIAYKLKNN